MIRRATFADVPGLRRLYAALTLELEAARPVPYPMHGQDDLDRFTLLTVQRIDEPSLMLYVATDDAGELVGFLGGEISERVLGEPRLFCSAHWLYVVPAARGRGIARALVRHGVADLEALGITHVELATYDGDLQWRARGWIPYLVHHALPLAAVLAGVAERPVVEPTAAAEPLPAAASAPPPVEEPPASEPVRRPVEELRLSVRPTTCLRNLEIRYVDELVHMTERELLDCRNFGRRSLAEIKEALSEFGLSLNTPRQGERPPRPRLIAGGRA